MLLKRQVEILFQISRALVGKESLQEILQQIVSLTADLIGTKICSLMLLDSEKKELHIKATQSLSLAYREKPPIPVGQSISGRVVLDKRPIQVEDVTENPLYGNPAIARQEGLKSLLSVPMMIGDRVLGVLNCYTDTVRSFNPEEVLLIQTIANQAAIAIEHMHVLDREREARLALETKKTLDQAKRILMKRYRMSEEEAHRFIQKSSMDRNKPQKEIAEALILAEELAR